MEKGDYKPSYNGNTVNGDAERYGGEPNNGRDKGGDDPFGDEENADVKYKTMAWWQAGMIMIAETVSLGILSLPSVLAAVGLVPGVILILGLGALATYTGFVIGQFKLCYPHVHNMADAGEVLLGPIGREIFGAAQIIFLIFVMGSHILTFSIMLNTISNHGACTIAFGIVGMVVCLIFTLPRTLHKVSYMSVACTSLSPPPPPGSPHPLTPTRYTAFISIIAAILITMIGVSLSPLTPNPRTSATVQTSLPKAFLAVTNIIFAYSGHVAFFSFISELRSPQTYPKALFLLQSVDTAMYLVAAVVIYHYAGSTVASPALGSTTPLLRKVAYGIAIPTIVTAGVINGHVAAKYIYVRLFRGTDRMSKNTLGSYGAWAGIAVVLWTAAWVVAEAIPVFNDLLGLISALFASWFTYGLSGVFWLYINKGKYAQSPKKIALTVLNSVVFCIGAVIVSLCRPSVSYCPCIAVVVLENVMGFLTDAIFWGSYSVASAFTQQV
ncbi:MAG: hypothetical protein M1830_009475 [Pleopsidium flavum]|nr:MAG: hypothetical protein M1830_009475 [Pleopsidium flavum]